VEIETLAKLSEENKELYKEVPEGSYNKTQIDVVDNESTEFSPEALLELENVNPVKKFPDEPLGFEAKNERLIKNEPFEILQGIIKDQGISKLNGSEIFNDGKISVKIKARPANVEPVVEEEKEKLNKVPQKRGRKSFKEIDAEADLIEIPEDEILFQRQYYPISQVAEWFKVNTSLVRFWENEFDILKPKKNRKGDRLFRPEDVKNLHLIYHLLRHRKYTIEGAKEYIKTNKKKADFQLQLTTSLEKIKSFLLDLKANL
jgi:DNA-binding transcriptional MerR regulator